MGWTKSRFAALAATAVVVVLGGCSSNGGSTAGTPCTTDSICGSEEMCHPTGKVCVTKCTASADCPDTASNCVAIALPSTGDAGAADAGSTTAMICQCSTSAACNGNDSAGTLVCSDYDKACMQKCAADADCPGTRKCDTATGQCKAPVPTTCVPACTGNQVCDLSVSPPACITACQTGSCTGGKVCNNTTKLCEAGKTCSTSAQQPDVCTYGEYCGTGACADVAWPPSCMNFGPSAKPIQWLPATSTGPIIYAIEPLPGDDNTLSGTAFCAPNKTYTVKLKAYNANSQFAATGPQLGGLKYVKSDGSECDAVTCPGPIFRTVSGYTVSTDRKHLEIKISLCPTDQTLTSVSAGFYFTGGNEVCASVPD